MCIIQLYTTNLQAGDDDIPSSIFSPSKLNPKIATNNSTSNFQFSKVSNSQDQDLANTQKPKSIPIPKTTNPANIASQLNPVSNSPVKPPDAHLQRQSSPDIPATAMNIPNSPTLRTPVSSSRPENSYTAKRNIDNDSKNTPKKKKIEFSVKPNYKNDQPPLSQKDKISTNVLTSEMNKIEKKMLEMAELFNDSIFCGIFSFYLPLPSPSSFSHSPSFALLCSLDPFCTFNLTCAETEITIDFEAKSVRQVKALITEFKQLQQTCNDLLQQVHQRKRRGEDLRSARQRKIRNSRWKRVLRESSSEF